MFSNLSTIAFEPAECLLIVQGICLVTMVFAKGIDKLKNCGII